MIVVLFACNLLASLMQSLMNVALDYVSAEYHVSLSEANLLVLGYSIVAGIVIVLAALSLHRFGLRKRHALRADRVVFAGSILWRSGSGLSLSLGGGTRPISGRCHRPLFPW
ncbi:MAG: hypothetical protein ACLTDR_02710 [Adlercreutzia equolifaciens]